MLRLYHCWFWSFFTGSVDSNKSTKSIAALSSETFAPEPYQFPVLLQALIAVEDVVNPASIALQWDLPPLLTAGGTLALTGGEHQVLLPPVLVLHHSDGHTVQGKHQNM